MSYWKRIERYPTDQVSRELFIAVSIVGLIFALFAGIFLTSDCLSSERREGTLGLLFLTDLKGYDVVLGKLGATSIHAIYGLLAIIPVLGLPLLMGGVSAGQFYRTVLVLLLALLFSLSVGLFWSSVNSQSRQALSATLLSLLVVTSVLPSLGWLDSYAFGYTRVPQLFWLSPVTLTSKEWIATIVDQDGTNSGLRRQSLRFFAEDYWRQLRWSCLEFGKGRPAAVARATNA